MLVRFFDKPALDNKLRISVGSPGGERGVLAALDAALAQEPSRAVVVWSVWCGAR